MCPVRSLGATEVRASSSRPPGNGARWLWPAVPRAPGSGATVPEGSAPDTSQAPLRALPIRGAVRAPEPAGQGSSPPSTASSLAGPCLSLPICKPCIQRSPCFQGCGGARRRQG